MLSLLLFQVRGQYNDDTLQTATKKEQPRMTALFNARGAGDRLGVTSQRARQLFREGILPTTALLNGKVPLVDEMSLLEVARQREARRRAA